MNMQAAASQAAEAAAVAARKSWFYFNIFFLAFAALPVSISRKMRWAPKTICGHCASVCVCVLGELNLCLVFFWLCFSLVLARRVCVCTCVCLHFFGPGFYELYVCATRWPCKWSAEWGCQSGNFRNVLEAFAALFFLTLSSLPLSRSSSLSLSLLLTGVRLVFWLNMVLF